MLYCNKYPTPLIDPTTNGKSSSVNSDIAASARLIDEGRPLATIGGRRMQSNLDEMLILP
jgi:hypothetical protein